MMPQLHEAIFVVTGVLTLANLSVLGIFIFQHRLMWGDYKKRHKIDGSDDKAIG